MTKLRKGPAPRPLADRFWEKVDKAGECWEWTAARNPLGYGLIGISAARRCGLAHRVSWELNFGPIPAGLLVCHRCDNPSCVRPAHLFLGTHRDNHMDKINKGRHWHPRGALNPHAKVNEEDGRVMRGSADTHAALARRYDLTPAAVRAIRIGRNWPHVS
jgi:hypothetical protein